MQVTRNAFTLVELLASLAIISILIALALPAALRVRDSARQRQCESQIRQIGMAIQMFEQSFKSLPTNGRPTPTSRIRSKDGVWTTISTTYYAAKSTSYETDVTIPWGVGNPSLMGAEQTGSWAYSILPYLDQINAYQKVVVDARQPMFLCPARGNRKPARTVDDDYGSYQSAGYAWSKSDFALVDSFQGITMQNVDQLRGFDSAMAIGERSFNPRTQLPTSWNWDEPIFAGGAPSLARKHYLLVPDGPEANYEGTWGSAHYNGVHFAAVSGRVQLLSFNTDADVAAAQIR